MKEGVATEGFELEPELEATGVEVEVGMADARGGENEKESREGAGIVDLGKETVEVE